MKRNIVYLIIVVVAITVLLLVSKRMSHPVMAAAPDFELKVLGGNGKTMKLSDLKGKAVLVDFWATYCGPCKVEMPWIADLQKKYGPQGFQVVGVNVLDGASEKEIADFAKSMGVNYPILIGTNDVADLYFHGIDGLPQNFFIDRSGKLVDKKLGLISETEFEDIIKKSLAQGEPAKTASAR